MPRRKSKKRPCRICRKWFTPDPRVGDRQKTCGDPECMRKWHTKKCAEWNRKNRRCAQENYLHDKLMLAVGQNDESKKPSVADATAKSPVFVSHSAPFLQLPRSLIQEVIGAQHLVIIEYIARQLLRVVQEEISSQCLENTRNSSQLPPRCCSRGDSVFPGP
jgi:hypothetical protein